MRVKSFLQLNERIIMIRIETKPVDTVVLQVYMPTTDYEDEEVEDVYEDITEVIKKVRGEENLIILGDWNAVVGEGEDGRILGKFGLGIRNERGERLLEFCTEHKLVIANTLFKNPLRRRYTWKMPGDKRRFQLDYILVKQRFRNQVKDCKSYPGADIDSDHNLVMMKCHLKFKKLKKAVKNIWQVEKLNESQHRRAFQEAVDNKIEDDMTQKSVEDCWRCIRSGLHEAAKEVLGKRKAAKKKEWITDEVLQLIEERRKYKNAKTEGGQKCYKRIRNEICRKARKAREGWVKKITEGVQNNLKQGKVEAAYNIVKKHFKERSARCNTIRDKNGNILFENEDKVKRWKEYLEDLYKGSNFNAKIIEDESEVEKDDMGACILRSEFDAAIKDLQRNKAPGIDDIPAELIKYAGEKTLTRLYKTICDIYLTGDIPSDFEKNIIIPIPKKKRAEKCEDFRTISLTTHVSKILTRIIYRRIERRAEEFLAEDQFGFRKNKGTREAILALRILIEKRMEKNKPTFIAFVDLEKAFDNVDWNSMLRILKEIGVLYNDRRIVHSLYKNQVAVIKSGPKCEEARIKKGVRQGCALSPVIFNVYIEKAINEIKEKAPGISIHGERISMLRFADDIAVVAETEGDLKKVLTNMERTMARYKLKINKKKTKILVCSRKEEKRTNIKLGKEKLEEVKEFCYLGSRVTSDGRSKKEIVSRIAQAKRAFHMKKNLLTAENTSIEVRKQFIRCYIWSLFLYGSETWTLTAAEKSRVEAFEMWCYRRMMKIKWIDRVSNEEVLRRVEEKRSLLKTLKRRRDILIGHIMRHDGLMKTIIEGQVNGKRGKGRPRMCYIGQIIKDVGEKKYVSMKRLADRRAEWRAASNQSSDC